MTLKNIYSYLAGLALSVALFTGIFLFLFAVKYLIHSSPMAAATTCVLIVAAFIWLIGKLMALFDRRGLIHPAPLMLASITVSIYVGIFMVSHPLLF